MAMLVITRWYPTSSEGEGGTVTVQGRLEGAASGCRWQRAGPWLGGSLVGTRPSCGETKPSENGDLSKKMVGLIRFIADLR